MKLLMASPEKQGKRKSDFCFAPLGEILTFNSECDGEGIDGKCGCRRSMIGVQTLKATTTMKVAWAGMTVAQLEKEIRGCLVKSGWVRVMSAKKLSKLVKTTRIELMRVADFFPLGTVVEKRGDTFKARL